MHRAGFQLGRVLTIGRQNLFVSAAKVRQLLMDHGGVPPDRVAELIPDSLRYAEPVLLALGAESVDSMDFSDYEGATIVHDLNNPIPEGLRGRFDLVIDGGTIEHCFDLRTVLSNYMVLPRVGGSIVIQTEANNAMGHGFYQLSPEFFYRAFSPSNGYRVRQLIAFETFEYAPWYEVPDPAEIRSRIELANSWNAIELLMHAVREHGVPPLRGPVLQSDYAAVWETTNASGIPRAQPSREGLIQRLKRWIKQTLPSLVMAKHRFNDRHPGLIRTIARWRSARDRRRFSFEAQPDRFQYLRSKE
jgi:hypothetical protein